MSITGVVFNIQRFSIHDGPGIRTTVFLKGCSLRCFWCHNPEGLCPQPEIQFFPDRCIACGECLVKPTPAAYNMIPGIFSWAATILMGQDVAATPNGRHARAPISHGPNPDPGFRKDAAPTALALAVASVQPGYGNASPMQIDLDPGISRDEEDIGKIASLIRTHFDLGGTQININVLDKDRILEAHKDPSKFPDLVIRVTGFSAYFASLSAELRQLVADRVLAES